MLIAFAIFLCALSPAVAGAAPVTPTTVSLKQLNSQATDAVKPLMILAAVALAVSFLGEEISRTKRRRKRSGKVQRTKRLDPAPRRPKPPRRRVKNANARVAAPDTNVWIAPVVQSTLQPSSPTRDSTQMWGRSAGGSAAERAAALERERANWAAGGDGERRVGVELDRLPSGEWWVFNDLPRGRKGTNVDHLVIGVGGVFSLNTKNVSGNVWVAERVLMVAGEKTNYLPVAVSEGRDVSQRLARVTPWTGQARPLLVFLKPATIKAMPGDVTVLHVGNVRDWLQHQPRVLTPQQAYEIVLAANQPATWA